MPFIPCSGSFKKSLVFRLIVACFSLVLLLGNTFNLQAQEQVGAKIIYGDTLPVYDYMRKAVAIDTTVQIGFEITQFLLSILAQKQPFGNQLRTNETGGFQAEVFVLWPLKHFAVKTGLGVGNRKYQRLYNNIYNYNVNGAFTQLGIRRYVTKHPIISLYTGVAYVTAFHKETGDIEINDLADYWEPYEEAFDNFKVRHAFEIELGFDIRASKHMKLSFGSWFMTINTPSAIKHQVPYIPGFGYANNGFNMGGKIGLLYYL